MAHETGMGNYIRAGVRSPISSTSEGNYTMLDDGAVGGGNDMYSLENGYDSEAGEPQFDRSSRRNKRRRDSDSDSDDSDSDDSDSDDDNEYGDDGGSRSTISGKLNDYVGLMALICLIILLIIVWFTYHIRKDIDSMFGE